LQNRIKKLDCRINHDVQRDTRLLGVRRPGGALVFGDLSPLSVMEYESSLGSLMLRTAATGGVPGAAAALGCSRRRIPKR